MGGGATSDALADLILSVIPDNRARATKQAMRTRGRERKPAWRDIFPVR